MIYRKINFFTHYLYLNQSTLNAIFSFLVSKTIEKRDGLYDAKNTPVFLASTFPASKY